MDPLTHTLFAAVAATTPQAQRTPLAAAALILGANLPDVDAFLYFAGFATPDRALAFRRGWTHGLPAMLVWPLVLAAILLLWRRLRPGSQPRASALVGFCCLGVWSHPCLDWLNTYGMRWLMPFDGTWFYGDAVFIADPWLWLVLGCGFLLAKRPRVATWVVSLVVAGTLCAWVAARAPRFLPLVLTIAVAALASLLVPLPQRARSRTALVALLLAVLYIGGRIGLQLATETRVRAELEARSIGPIERLMVGPLPISLRTWDVLVETPGDYRFGRFEWGGDGLVLAERTLPSPRALVVSDEERVAHQAWEMARRDPSVAGFVDWARFPWYQVEQIPDGVRVHLLDARYSREVSSGFGGAVVEISADRLDR